MNGTILNNTDRTELIALGINPDYIFNVDSFPYNKLDEIEECPDKRKKHRDDLKRYLNIVTAFDIETTNITELKNSAMYIWQWAFDGIGVCIGRTWDEYRKFVWQLSRHIKHRYVWLVAYVHNLSFEFEWLQGIHSFATEDVFAVESRKVLDCCADNFIEFRCSYLQTGMGLATFTEEMQVKHKKLSGEDYNYHKLRFPWTDMTGKELAYCINDVLGLVEAMNVRMSITSDTLVTVPRTLTGYVRRVVKQALYKSNQAYIEKILPDFDVYTLLREAFRGGNTHANRHYVANGDNIETLYNVTSMDMASAYPAAQINGQFPVTPFKRVSNPQPYKAVQYKEKGYAFVTRAHFENIRLKDRAWGCPYIPKDKCRAIPKTTIDGHLVDNALYDNGRILRARTLEITITDIDYDIISEEYDWDDVVFADMYISKYGALPQAVKNVILDLFRNKTQLKGNEEKILLYALSKAMLNSVYGLSAQNPVRLRECYGLILDEGENPIIYNNIPLKGFQPDMSESPKDILEKYRRQVNFPYQWGVWTTAICRRNLENGMRLIHDKYNPFTCFFVYCDTDSVKYVDEDKVVDWDLINKPIEEMSRANGAIATNENTGKQYVLGVFEFDGFYKEFRTMGAKRYAYIDDKDEFHITLAGVDKREGARELSAIAAEKGVSPIDLFKDGMLFGVHTIPEYKDKKGNIIKAHKSTAGGTISKFNDCGHEPVEIDGHTLELPPNIYIENTTKNISRTEAYTNLTILVAMCTEYLNRCEMEEYLSGEGKFRWYNDPDYNEHSKGQGGFRKI